MKYNLSLFCEIDKYAEQSYCAIHSADESQNVGDITKVDETKVSDFNVMFGGSPCFVKGTKITTENGYKNIEDVSIGDMVLTHKNRYMPVVRIGGERDKRIFSLKAQGSLELQCTEDHPFFVKKHKGAIPQKIRLNAMEKGYFLGSQINTRSENLYNLSDEDCWILGRYIADGHVRKTQRKHRLNSYQYQLVLSVGSNKIDEIQRIVTNRHYSCYPHTQSTHRVVFSSKELVDFVLEHEFGKCALDKRIPKFIFDLPIDKLKIFLNGYMSGDGNINGSIWQATTVSKELAMGICQVVQKVFRVGCRIYYVNRNSTWIIEDRIVNQHDTYQIRFDINPQKHHWFIEDGIIWYPVKKIFDTGKRDDVFNIEVKDDHTYVANNLITYNCQDFSIAGEQSGAMWSCNNCGHIYNPLEAHYTTRDHCPECGSTNITKTRSSLIVEWLRFLREKKPRFAIYENVKNLAGARFKPTFDLFLKELDEYGYNVYWKVLNAVDYGVPQTRERVYCIIIRKDLDNGKFKFPDPFPLTKFLPDVLEPEVDKKYYLSPEKVKSMTAMNIVPPKE